MSVSGGPDIVENGLVLCLDAGNTKSYPGSGTVWTDLSRNGNNGTLTNGPTFGSADGGAIVFDGSNDYVTVPSLPNFANINQLTAIVWAKSAVANWNESGFLISRRNQFIIHPNAGSKNVAFYINSNGWTDGTVNYTPDNIMIYNQYSITYNAGALRGYGNGILRSSGTVGAGLTSDSGKTEIGRDEDIANRFLNGSIAMVQVYYRALSATEILQNYNATKGRFRLQF